MIAAQESRRAVFVALSLLHVMATADPVSSDGANGIAHELLSIDSGKSWVSAYWGYNAPKLAHDGSSFYTVGMWGATFEESMGTIYRITGRDVERGIELPGIMQPPMVLLDSQGRLVVACARPGQAPLLLHGSEPGSITEFEKVPLPSSITSGRYMGAGIHEDTLVMGFLQGDESDFHFLICDLASHQWAEPVVLQKGQVETFPRTSWVYPIIVPRKDGVHMLVTNADTGYTYNKVQYLFIPHVSGGAPVGELLAEVPHGEEKVLFGQSLWVSDDGTVNAVVLYQPAHTIGLYAFHRDPTTGEWADTFLKRTPVGMRPGDEDFVRTGIVKAGNATLGSVGGLFEDPSGRLWLTATAGDRLDLFGSKDRGRTWTLHPVQDFRDHDLRYTYFLHGLHPGSGGTMPAEPHAVFTTTIQDGYKQWMVRFQTDESHGE